ncbi:NADH-quinone oxidoreductase subunit K [Janibacter limosus]|uniref:NADH-quinone oxidoreductase subunit K n=1 Tax=Janibacter limosus TaxID=53458 RepID=A0AC61U5G7_9MICO|nr:NADH-quinone oxidoreductase subunit K [Janibacter limosus]UUZ45286.1 NADH-quinone oxidoreductase subunit K [Janibacter limosus]
MSPNAIAPSLTLVVVAGFLIASGVYLLLERALTRLLPGIVLASNGVATLYPVVSGPAKGAPFVGARPSSEMSDPLPRAMVLTAIVIALASVAFVLSLAYRQWRITGSDDVPDDAEDDLIKRLADRDEVSSTYDPDTQSTTTADEEDATA